MPKSKRGGNTISQNRIFQTISIFVTVRRADVVHLQRRQRRFRGLDTAQEVEGESERSNHQGRVHEVGLRRGGRPARTCGATRGRG